MHFLQIACLLFAHEFWRCVVLADFTATTSPLNDKPDDEHLDLEAINGTRYDYLSYTSKDITGNHWESQDGSWDDGRKKSHITRSLRLAKCEKLQNIKCFGINIQYKFTSIQLSDEQSQEYSFKKLNQLGASRFVPMCWAVIQPFLCAVYMPRCTRSKDREYVYLPSFEMCRVTSEPCRILYDNDFFPKNLRCDKQVFPCENCTNDVREMKFNATGECKSPLVATESSINHYPGIEGCGLRCKNPMYTDEEHESVHTLIFWGTILCIICNLFVIATFLIHDWKHSKHPAWNLFYISICFLFNWIGWMLQFIPGHRENIVCRRDGTLRYSEPSAGENLACIVPFILIYYFLIAANVWFAIFTYAWYLQTKDRGSIRDRIEKESFYFHFIAWALPFILTVTIMVLSEVDGNSIIGICFVGYQNRAIRNGLVMAPVAILSFGVSVFFSFKGGFNLNRIKYGTNNNDESKKLSAHILGMGIRTMLVVFFIFAFFIFDSYEVRNAELWKKSLKDFIICKIKESYHHQDYMIRCRLQNRPSVTVLQLRLLCLFGVNLMIASWCWTWPALKTWKRFIKKKVGYEHSDDEKFTKPKHRIIADAYAKRMDDVISISFQNSHTDPAGLNFDMNNLNSAESDAMGTTLTNYLSNIIHRRNAMTRVDLNEPNSNCAPYASSCTDNNSEISVSVRQFSVESRRNSCDSQVSQVSVKMSETNIKATLGGRSQKHKSVNMKAKKRQMYAHRTNRRASSSSIESLHLESQRKHIKYKHKHPHSGIQVNANTMGHQIERLNESTTADINEVFEQKQLNQIILTSDDEQSMQIANQSLKTIVPVGDYYLRPGYSADSMDVPNDIEQMIKNIDLFRNSNPKKTHPNDLPTDGFGKSNRSAMRNGQSQRYSSKTLNDKDIATSINIERFQRTDGTQNSFSDQSVNRTKIQSQNSKGSCDYDITSPVKHIGRDKFTKSDLPEKIRSNYQPDDDYTETHQLLPSRKRELPSIIRKENLSESERMEKLKKLLLP